MPEQASRGAAVFSPPWEKLSVRLKTGLPTGRPKKPVSLTAALRSALSGRPMLSTLRRASLAAKAKLLAVPLATALVLGIAIGANDRAPRATAATNPASATGATTAEPTTAESQKPALGKRTTPTLPETPSLGGVWMLLLALAAGGVVIVMVAKRNGLARAGNGQLAVVDSIALGPKRLVHLVRCGDRRFLLASSEAGVSCLASLPQEPHEAEIDALSATPGAESEFRRLLEPSGSQA
jgi:flagellar biogenesis protein FliO